MFIRLTPINIIENPIFLPSPDLKGYIALDIAIKKVNQTSMLEDKQITINEISQLMWALQGITHGPNFRTVPSAGATYPLEIFLLHKGTSDLKSGYYKYIPYDHKLIRISDQYNERYLLEALTYTDKEIIRILATHG